MMLLAPLGTFLIALILLDGFESILLTRRVARSLRITRIYYRGAWTVWTVLGRLIASPKRRAFHLSMFGPLSLIVLFAFWAAGLIVAFGLVHLGLGTRLNPPGTAGTLGETVYFSGVTFFTLGYGDLAPASFAGRALAVAEAGVGFAFLAIVISYLPVLYQSFSRRETTIALLDARAGSPPTGAELLVRLGPRPDPATLARMMEEWERWSADLLESHISYPLLAFYRSQHDNQSWLAALGVILDAGALTLSVLPEGPVYQARLTFAIARHAAVDLSQVLGLRPLDVGRDRLPVDRQAEFFSALTAAGWAVRAGDEEIRRLAELRSLYEPFLRAMERYFHLPLPPIRAETPSVDNWQTSAWMQRARGLRGLSAFDPLDDHRDA